MKRILRCGALSFGSWMLLAAGLLAAESALDEARRALNESVPQVARRKLRVVLDSPGLTESQWAEATRLMAEAQRATGRREEALATLDHKRDKNPPKKHGNIPL